MGFTLRSARKLVSWSFFAVSIYYVAHQTLSMGRSISDQAQVWSEARQYTPFCSEAEYLDGHWEKRGVELTNFDEVRTAYNLTVSDFERELPECSP